MIRRVLAVALLALGMLGLTGCGERAASFEDLAEQRDQCEDLGGTFEQWQGGFGNELTRCDLSTERDGDE